MLGAVLTTRCSCRLHPVTTWTLNRGLYHTSAVSAVKTLQHSNSNRGRLLNHPSKITVFHPIKSHKLSQYALALQCWQLGGRRTFSSSSKLASTATAASTTTTSTLTETVGQAAATVTEVKDTITETLSTPANLPPMASDGKEELVLSALIPDRPSAVSTLTSDSATHVAASLEPTLESLGLASWMPPGRVQYFLEWMHVTGDIPWWGCILIATVTLRLATFPLVIVAQRNAANMANHGPEMQVLMAKVTEARRRGDQVEVAQATMEMKKFHDEKGISFVKNMVPLMVQIPIFMSMFFALRGMAYLPVESMTWGGFTWFSDLTVADPYYMLPLLTSTTLYLQLYFATEGASLDQAGPILRGFMKAMPVFLFPITMNFPAALTFYWLSTNVMSVGLARLVRLPYLREKLGIPQIINRDKSQMPAIAKKKFSEAVRESIDNFKVSADIADRRAYDEAAFRDAGMTDRPPRTYKYDPTKPYIKKKKYGL